MEHDSASILGGVEFFDVCNDEQIRLLAFSSENLNFRAGQVIVEKGEMSEGAYIINYGCVIIGESAQNTTSFCGPGVMIGELNLLMKRVHQSTITAQGEVDCLFVPRGAFQKLLKQYPDLASYFIEKIEAGLDDYLQSINLSSLNERNVK